MSLNRRFAPRRGARANAPGDVFHAAAVHEIGETQHLEGVNRECGAAAREDAFLRARFRHIALHLKMRENPCVTHTAQCGARDDIFLSPRHRIRAAACRACAEARHSRRQRAARRCRGANTGAAARRGGYCDATREVRPAQDGGADLFSRRQVTFNKLSAEKRQTRKVNKCAIAAFLRCFSLILRKCRHPVLASGGRARSSHL